MSEHTMSMYANRDDMIAALQSDLTAERTAHDATKGDMERLRARIERLADSLNDDGGEGFAKAELRTLLTPITRTDGGE